MEVSAISCYLDDLVYKYLLEEGPHTPDFDSNTVDATLTLPTCSLLPGSTYIFAVDVYY